MQPSVNEVSTYCLEDPLGGQQCAHSILLSVTDTLSGMPDTCATNKIPSGTEIATTRTGRPVGEETNQLGRVSIQAETVVLSSSSVTRKLCDRTGFAEAWVSPLFGENEDGP